MYLKNEIRAFLEPSNMVWEISGREQMKKRGVTVRENSKTLDRCVHLQLGCGTFEK